MIPFIIFLIVIVLENLREMGKKTLPA